MPVTLLYRKDTPLDGSAPCLLYGYGAYGISIPAGFNTNCLSLADRGFVYAIAHIRGGKDKGFALVRGRQDGLQDQHLQGLHRRRRLSESTEVHVLREDRRRGRIGRRHADGRRLQHGAGEVRRASSLPFLSSTCSNTMLDDSLPLTPPEWPEWGNPIESRDGL